MKLRLTEYKDGKFERFLDLGSDFGYFGDFILVSNDYEQDFRAEYTPISDTELDGSCGSVDPTAERFALDKKDPLNRFDGLFDGRTYGEGRFVLVEGLGIKDLHDKEIYIDDILAKYTTLTQDSFLVRGNRTHNTGYEGGNFYGINLYYHTTSAIFDSEDIDLRSQILGNLHENSELWEKVK